MAECGTDAARGLFPLEALRCNPDLIGMNRRDFTRGALALTLLPKLPVPAVAAGSTGAAASAAATANHMYFMGWYTARTSKAVSPQVLIEQLKVTPDVAQELFGRLVANRTVTPPDALGMSRALDPLPRRVRPGSRILSEKMKEMAGRAKERLGEMLEEERSEAEAPDQALDEAPDAVQDEAEVAQR